MKKINVLLLAGALGAFGCGDAGQQVGGAYGSLGVTVAGVSNGSGNAVDDVVRVDVTLTPQLPGTAQAYAQSLVKNGAVWEAGFDRIYVGQYQVLAQGFNANDELTFISSGATGGAVTVTAGSNQKIVIVMNQLTEAVNHDAIRINMVTLTPREISPDEGGALVDQGELLDIVVSATGGVGVLALSGRHAQSDINAGKAGVFGAMVQLPHDDTNPLTWQAPLHSGPAWLVLVVIDTEGNKAEIGITIPVGPDFASGDFELVWNLAPMIDLHYRSLNDHESFTAYLWARATDDGVEGPGAFHVQYTTMGFPPCSSNPVLEAQEIVGPQAATVNSPELGVGTWHYLKYTTHRDDLLEDECVIGFHALDEQGAAARVNVTFDTTWENYAELP